MNRKEFWIPSVEDVKNEGCGGQEREVLLDIFESRMKTMACTTLDKGIYNSIDDFFLAKKHGIKGFSLTMERYTLAGAEQWIGIFEAEGKRLEVFGTLAEPTD